MLSPVDLRSLFLKGTFDDSINYGIRIYATVLLLISLVPWYLDYLNVTYMYVRIFQYRIQSSRNCKAMNAKVK